ncbi:katanin-interacting protein-like isoform X2 [Lytechinus variegatus]|uniref:katanin-interacting protein-like isoform X2 n=1 Tax=Lytechinus variegatus TaxID=7654 RepID=UPI001BB1FFC0|nr:katanin-interacting protein-like isoform X2 [Lytechinus variegatus]
MDRGRRKQWQKEAVSPPKIADANQTPRGAYEGPDKYDEYLIQLQYKNRLLKQLKAKDEKQIALERKEQGFSLYVNGAHTNLAGAKHSPRKPTTKKPKTAGDYPRRALIGQIDVHDDLDLDRAKTAPEKVQRKNWTKASVDIKTDQGERLKLKSRLAQATEYSEDFEVYESIASQADHEGDEDDGENEERKNEEEEEEEKRDRNDEDEEDYSQLTKQMTVILEGASDGDSDLEIDASQYTKEASSHQTRRKKGGKTEEEEEDEEDDDIVNQQLLLSIEDVKTLRRSLEANPHIRRSICRKGTDSDEESSSEDDIEEEDEDEIEEELDVADDSLDAGRRDSGEKMKIEPGDMIVLDFASHMKPKSRELVTAKRKENADDVYFPPRSSQDDLKKQGTPKHRDIVMDSGPVVRKSTPLQTQKKKDEETHKWASTPKDDVSAIQKAMAAENRVATATRTQSGARTAPKEETKPLSPSPDDMPKRPVTVILHRGDENKPETDDGNETEEIAELSSASIESSSHDPLLNSQNLDDLKLAMALEKVKDMDAKSQRRLLKVLGRLEDSTSPRSSRNTPRHHPLGNLSTEGASESDIFKGPKLAPRSKSASSSKSSSLEASSPVLEVVIEINSNWGHPSRVGVTEVQFFDLQGQRLTLQPSSIEARNAEESKGELANIINAKMKTTKERNMWSCEYEKGSPILLLFRIPSSPAGSGISKMKIWNFNKTLKDLNIGVKEARVLLGDKVIWEGTVDKGCGNQVFDYSTTIMIPMECAKENASNSIPPDAVNKEKQTAILNPDTQRTELSEQRKNVEQRLHGAGDKGLQSNHPQGKSVEGRLSNPNKSNSNSNGNEDRDDDGSGELRRSIAFEIDLDLFPSKPDQDPKVDQTKRKDLTQKPIEKNKTKGQTPAKPKPSATHPPISLSTPSSAQKGQVPKISVDPKHTATSSASLEASVKDSIGSSQDLGLRPGVSESFSPEDPRQTIRCETRVLMRSTDATLDLPVVDDSIHIYATPRSSLDASREKTPIADDDVTPRAVPVGLESSPNKTIAASEQDTSFDKEESSMLDQLKELTGSKPKQQKPPWLNILDDEVNKSDSSIPEEEEADPLDTGNPWPGMLRRNSADRRPSNEILDYDETSMEPAGRRSRNQVQSQSKIAAMADDMEELRWRQKAAEGGISDEDHLSPPARFEKRPHQSRSHQERSLEESWTSLSLFDKSQKGRLASNVNLDVEGDVLDTILSGRRSKTQEDADNDDSSDEFEIPILPFGHCMTINVKTTWGDRHYIGLNGIEIFQSNGEHVQVAKITAEPCDLNMLPEHTNDPRVVSNLIDGVNCTRDDIHMWLAPFTPGRMHLITMIFAHPVKVAMIRIWNYNKSRIHSFRGAKDIEISLDDKHIFKGEIARASGALQGDPSSFGDTILFTEDEEILELISKNDEVYVAAEDWFSSSMDEDAAPPTRPRTADMSDERPMTTARQNRARPSKSESIVETGQARGNSPPPRSHDTSSDSTLYARANPATTSSWITQPQNTVFRGRHMKLNFTLTWGDIYYLGLTGLEIMDIEGDAIPITMDMIDACPRDLNELPDYGTDDRTLDKLLDGTNVTSSDEHMWMIPFTEGAEHLVTIDFGREVQMTGLRIWNYNKSPEDTYRGAKIVHVWIDGQEVSPSQGYLIRKGPGKCYFDFAQDISFVSRTNWQASVGRQQRVVPDSLRQSQVALEVPSQEYIPMHMPCGFVFQLQLLSTYGDLYYVGLNGLEFYDAQGEKMELTESNIAAYPPSINVLEGVSDDTRTPEKLIDGVNDTMDGGHIWLAPILPSVINRVYVIFDEPATVSMIKLWNYSKTPARGVKDFGLLVDDLLVYQGILGQVTSAARGILPSMDVPIPYHTILFADNAELRRRERHTILQNQQQEQDVQMTDDHQVVAHFKNPKKSSNKTVDQALRPKTSVITQSSTRRR